MKNSERNGVHRRALLAQLAAGGGAIASMTPASRAHAATLTTSQNERLNGWYDLKGDFNAIGNGAADDTDALQTAIDSGSKNVRPIACLLYTSRCV